MLVVERERTGNHRAAGLALIAAAALLPLLAAGMQGHTMGPAALTVLWVLLVVPTLTVWQDSLIWIALMSIYANISTHWGAYEASRAKEVAEQANGE